MPSTCALIINHGQSRFIFRPINSFLRRIPTEGKFGVAYNLSFCTLLHNVHWVHLTYTSFALICILPPEVHNFFSLLPIFLMVLNCQFSALAVVEIIYFLVEYITLSMRPYLQNVPVLHQRAKGRMRHHHVMALWAYRADEWMVHQGNKVSPCHATANSLGNLPGSDAWYFKWHIHMEIWGLLLHLLQGLSF